MLSAYSTLFLVVIYHIYRKNYAKDIVDRSWMGFVRPTIWRRQSEQAFKQRVEALERAVLLFSDTQVVTGLAILVAGYSQLNTGISTYHWQIVTNLAWFSSLTHLATLTSLRDYFRSHQRKALRRVAFIGLVLVLLIVALGPAGYIPQYLGDGGYLIGAPMECFFSSTRIEEVKESEDGSVSYNKAMTVFSIMFLLVNFITRVIEIFPTVSKFKDRWLRQAPGNALKTWYVFATHKAACDPVRRTSTTFWNIGRFLLIVLYTVSKAYYQVTTSTLWEVRRHIMPNPTQLEVWT